MLLVQRQTLLRIENQSHAFCRMRKRTFIWFGVAFSLASGVAMAENVPTQLYNKTIVLGWTYVGSGRPPDGHLRNFQVATRQTIYVSGAGRLFVRGYVGSRRRERVSDKAPGDTIGGQGHARVDRFEGDTLVGTSEFASGARQFKVTFDAAFSSCELGVLIGSTGKPIRLKAPNGTMWDNVSMSAVAPTCSIRNGNAFAGE